MNRPEAKKQYIERNVCGDFPPQANGAQTSACCSGAPAQPQPNEIPQKIGLLFANTESLSESIASLRARLAPVSVQFPEPIDKSDPQECSTKLGGTLAQLNARVELMLVAVAQMIARLEI